MSIDHALQPNNADDRTVVYPQAYPQQLRYEAPAGLGQPTAMPGYAPGGPGVPPVFPPGPPLPTPPAGGKRRTGLIVALISGLTLLAAGIGTFFLFFATGTVDPNTVVKEITRVTEENDHVAPTGVLCPSDVPLEKGRTFTCTANLLNKPVTYTITINDDKGAVTINYARPVLDPASVTAEVVRTTQAELGVKVTDVQCPANVRFEKGGTFTCTAALEGQRLNYQITQTDDNGALRIAHDRVVAAKEVSTELARQLTKTVGEQIVAECAKDGQTMIVNAVGQPITCGAANAANPDRNAQVTVQIDAQGVLTYQF